MIKMITFFINHRRYIKPFFFTLILLIVLGIGTIIFSFYQLKVSRDELKNVRETLGNEISELKTNLSNTEYEKEQLTLALEEEKEKFQAVEKKVKNIAGTVGVLEKLSKTDEELLQKYSKVYFLNEHYLPNRLVEIDGKFVSGKDEERILAEVSPHLEDLLTEASEDGVELRITSAYRSFSEQASIKSNYKFIYGAGTANQFSADQGYSEHQLGTTVDFTTSTSPSAFDGFDKTAEYKWLTENAYRYGFILSYPPNNSYYQFEPWHWRFVGEKLARKLKREDKYFYDYDQREIDKYLVSIFD